MPIKWNIAGKATEARANMDAISKAYDKLNQTARGHRADVEGIAGQVDDMQSDLEHAANVMGNGGGHSDEHFTESNQGASAANSVATEASVVTDGTFHAS